ncbi:flagellar basal-body rod protein FlgB [Thermocrinis albus DSM 14484]|uniref:Flagellar basal-body rod protein FlgB n=1 Tax=Thermocrinis albus (strain DSM 14484 / JCM 11386 / HI 11/12) TaxID=638303 RepID=D3SQ47_THEAH|nr:flagellar basal-body rod protein FlgB [Thermocrinis albus]ADC89284.1 flagellar basal-body rod protein FlgB [Thermocrinis albus DSM 14484]
MMGLFDTVNRIIPLLDERWLRHKVIVSNIANADTPRYMPKELLSLRNSEIPLKTTRPRHIDPENGVVYRVVEVKRSLVGNDLNGVSLEEEISKLIQNKLAYETYMYLAKRSLDGIGNVLRDAK